MTSLGPNFSFKQSPDPKNRRGRHKTGGSAIPQGAPVAVPDDAVADGNGRTAFELVTSGEPPRPGKSGICVWEARDANFAGYDPVLTTATDLRDAPANTPAQLVSGTEVVVALINTGDFSFDGQRDYPGRVMVGGLDATPTVAVGTLLMPGPGTDDTTGYWQEADSDENAWLIVTEVGIIEGGLGRDNTLSFVHANLLF